MNVEHVEEVPVDENNVELVARADRAVAELERAVARCGAEVRTVVSTLELARWAVVEQLAGQERSRPLLGDCFPVPHAVAYQLRDALAGAIGWLESLQASGEQANELREALIALSRYANPGAPRFAVETAPTTCKACGGLRDEHNQSPRCRGFE